MRATDCEFGPDLPQCHLLAEDHTRTRLDYRQPRGGHAHADRVVTRRDSAEGQSADE